jgi:predicted nuclease of predicted toxin-antitoxin system
MTKFVIDMNLSPRWAPALRDEGWEAVHWADVGDQAEEDDAIARWARENQAIVLTQDLDFGEILAITNADGPSTVLLRTRAVRVEQLAARLMPILRQAEEAFDEGALLVISNGAERLRLLPLGRRTDA